MIGTQLRDALSAHPASQMAEQGALETLAARPEDIRTVAECTDVLNYLEAKITSIEGQLETSRIAAEQRGANDAYLDWHTKAHHALSMTQFGYHRVKKQRHLLYLQERDVQQRAHEARMASARKAQAEARARNAEVQLQIVQVAAERSVQKQVCVLVQARFGKDVHGELFDTARGIVSAMKTGAAP